MSSMEICPFNLTWVNAIEREGASMPVIIALIQELSDGRVFLEKTSRDAYQKTTELAKKFSQDRSLIEEYYSMSDRHIANFEFDSGAWNSLIPLTKLPMDLRFLMSSRMGLGMTVIKELVFSQPPAQTEMRDWNNTARQLIRDFLMDESLQIKWIINRFKNNCSSIKEGEQAGVALLIARFFDPTAAGPTNRSQAIAKQAAINYDKWERFKYVHGFEYYSVKPNAPAKSTA